jgi:threonine/homoserine efflux transporter RhtA
VRHEEGTTVTAAVVSATVAMVSFQIGATFAKQLIPTIGPAGTTAARLGLSAVLLLVLAASLAIGCRRARPGPSFSPTVCRWRR